MFFAAAILFSACGSGGDITDDVPSDSPPIVMRVDPAIATAGDQITIFGIGFSAAAPTNIIIIGDAGIYAESYQLIPNPIDEEAEAITAVIPAGIAPDLYPILVVVGENTSNSDVMITIN